MLMRPAPTRVETYCSKVLLKVPRWRRSKFSTAGSCVTPRQRLRNHCPRNAGRRRLLRHRRHEGVEVAAAAGGEGGGGGNEQANNSDQAHDGHQGEFSFRRASETAADRSISYDIFAGFSQPSRHRVVRPCSSLDEPDSMKKRRTQNRDCRFSTACMPVKVAPDLGPWRHHGKRIANAAPIECARDGIRMPDRRPVRTICFN